MNMKKRNIAGIDLTDYQSYFCVMDCTGCVIKHGYVETKPLALQKQFSGLDSTVIVITASRRVKWIENLLTVLGHEVTWRGARISA